MQNALITALRAREIDVLTAHESGTRHQARRRLHRPPKRGDGDRRSPCGHHRTELPAVMAWVNSYGGCWRSWRRARRWKWSAGLKTWATGGQGLTTGSAAYTVPCSRFPPPWSSDGRLHRDPHEEGHA